MAKSAYEKVYESLKKTIQKTDTSKFTGSFAFQFNVTGDAAGIFYVEFKEGYTRLAVENFSYDDHTAIFEADAETFTALVEGKTTAKAAPKKETTKKPSAKKPAASKAKKDESKS